MAALKVPVTRLVTDSRSVQRGDTFVAYPGEKADGRQFIANAIMNGANAVIYESLASGQRGEARHFVWNDAWQVPSLAVADLRHKAGWLADAVYGSPSESLWVVGITGTNGKTSTSHWIAHALSDAGKRCAVIGTLGNGFIDGNADALQSTANTTPDAVRVHGLLADYLREGAQSVAMEVSSHALSQGRVNAVRFNVAMLTNLSRDHLDYHGDMESYAAAKRKLFDWQQLDFVVLNLDDAIWRGTGRAVAFDEGRRAASGKTAADPVQHGPVTEVIGYGMGDEALQRAERLGLRMVYGKLQEMSGQGLKSCRALQLGRGATGQRAGRTVQRGQSAGFARGIAGERCRIGRCGAGIGEGAAGPGAHAAFGNRTATDGGGGLRAYPGRAGKSAAGLA